MEKIYKITAAIDANIPDDENPESPNSESKTPTISYYTEMLALARQQEIFIRWLINNSFVNVVLMMTFFYNFKKTTIGPGNVGKRNQTSD